MKKIINGKVYDTDKAQEIGFEQNTGGCRDLHWVCETLYRKRTGEFFLLGEGGPGTNYAVSSGNNNWGCGSKIIPLTWVAAREWAEKHLDADSYEAVFGAIAEDESRVTVTLSLSAGAIERAKRAASQAGISISAYIESLI